MNTHPSSITRRRFVCDAAAGVALTSIAPALTAAAPLRLKFEATQDPKVRELARRTVNTIVTLWNNASPPAGLGGGGRSWFPKPYGGMATEP